MASDLILMIVLSLCMLLCITFLWKLRKLDDKEMFLWQMTFNILLILLLFCIFVLISLIYLSYSTVSRTGLFVLCGFFAVAAGLCASFINQKIRFSELLGEEAGPKVTLPSKLKRGNTYLIKDRHRKRAFKLFSDAVAQGLSGLAITRQNPKNVVKSFKLRKAKLIWLTEIKNGKNLSPTDLEEISYIINNFVNHEKRSIILFDGFEYLSDYNSFNKVLHLFQVLKDNISVKKSILILYINPKTLEKKHVKLLENEFKTI